MQVNRGGIILIVCFALAGFLLAVVPLALGIEGMIVWILALIGVIWMLTAAGLALYARGARRKGDHQVWVFRNGIKGTATVVDAGSHAVVNGMPLMKLTLDLEIPGVVSGRAGRREVMPIFVADRMRPGLVLPAYCNPDDPKDFILVW